MIVTDKRVVEFVCQQIGARDNGAFVGIGWEQDGEIVAGWIFDDFNGANIMASYAGKFYGQPYFDELHKAVFSYPFKQLGAKRVTGFVVDNPKSTRYALSLGGEIEFVMKNAHPKGDMAVLLMTKERCKFI